MKRKREYICMDHAKASARRLRHEPLTKEAILATIEDLKRRVIDGPVHKHNNKETHRKINLTLLTSLELLYRARYGE